MLKLRIALRYIFSRKSHSIINLIAVVAVVAVAVPVAATVFVMSMHNGLADRIHQMYGEFDPNLKIQAVDAMFFDQDSINVEQIEKIEGVEVVGKVIEVPVLVEYDGKQLVGMVKGIEKKEVVMLDSLVVRGEAELESNLGNQILVGQGVAAELGINVAMNKTAELYSLVTLPMVKMPIFNVEQALPVGVFAVDKMTDSQYLIAQMDLVRKLSAKENMITAVEVKLTQNADQNEVAEKIKKSIGERFSVKTQIQQRDGLFKIINIEKWITFLLVSVIIFIAALSLVGAIVIMVTEKNKQNYTLMQLGYTNRDIRTIFNWLGITIASVGIVVGLILGLAMSFVQYKFGLLTIEGSFIVDVYPVKILLSDIITIFGLVFAVTSIITLVTTKNVKIGY